MRRLLRIFRRSKPLPKTAPGADTIQALNDAIEILDKICHGMYLESGDSPQWRFLLHAQLHLERQREEAFRQTIGQGEGVIRAGRDCL